MLKTLVKCMAKPAEDSAKEATKKQTKKDQHILLKVQDTDLAAREAHYHATCRRDYTREDDRHQEAIKDTFTKSKRKLPTRPYKKKKKNQYIVQYVMARIV